MVKDFAPMLAGKAPDDLSLLRYPVLASPKLDGIRCVVLGGKALSRKLKPIPNDRIRTWAETHLPDGIDGELMLQDHKRPFEEVSSAVMSKHGEPDFVFMAFDKEDSRDFNYRFTDLVEYARRTFPVIGFRLSVVPHLICDTEEELRLRMAEHLEQGYEGTMVRDPNGPYKFGRSTTKEGYLLKIKTFEDEEAEIVGIFEKMHNGNEATVDNLGRTKRSSAKAGKTGLGVMGAVVVRLADGTLGECGSGFTAAQCKEVWDLAAGSGFGDTTPVEGFSGAFAVAGGLYPPVTIRFQPPPGGRKPGQAPRFPVFKGFRHD